jgi:vancomycin resistance protein YoaR
MLRPLAATVVIRAKIAEVSAYVLDWSVPASGGTGRDPSEHPRRRDRLMSNSKSASFARFWRRWWWAAIVSLLVLGAAGRVHPLGRNRVSQGIFIGDVALGGLSWEEARRNIWNYLQRREHQPLAFAGETGICTATMQNLGATVDLAKTLAELRRVAANRQGFRGWLQARVMLRPTIVLDPSTFDTWLADCENRAIAKRPVEGRLIPKDGDWVIQQSRAGRRIARDRMPWLVAEAVAWSDTVAPALPIVDQGALPALSALERARIAALELVAKAVVLRSELSASRLTLLRVDLTKMIEWQTQPDGEVGWRLSRSAFDQWLGSRRHRVEQRARDATYEVHGRDHLVVVAERKGNRIAVDRLFSDLEQRLREGVRQLDIPFEPTELPKRSVADLDKLNIHEPVGTFTTRHACCQPRVNNIHRIADLLNGTIVAPGETFSLNEYVGQRTVDNGFVPAPSIQDGEMVDSIGGGVSQFATTYYNAMMRAGYEILERQAHTYWFDRYPMGHEATLSWPKPDVVIRNDTQSGLLVLTSYTDTSITVRLFGDREGRRVEWSVSQRFDSVRPNTEYLPNGELDPSREHVKEGGCIGWSVWTMRTVTLKDGSLKKDKRKVIYKPRIRRVEVHPCKIPKGEPGHTGEKCPEPSVEAEATSTQAAEATTTESSM